MRYLYRFGSIVFDESKLELRVDGIAVDVQRLPLQILALLLAQCGEIVTREELFDKLWQGRPTVDNVLASAITKLRNALGEGGAVLIENVPRVGYRFTGRFERTRISTAMASQLGLDPGQPVAQRGRFVLERMIRQSSGQEVWLARDSGGSERRVYKFACDARRIADLKREVALLRLLRSELGEREDLVRVLECNFSSSPCFLETEFGGEDLLTWADTDDRLTAQSAATRLDLLLQAADVVAAVHSVGILHRDLKPENILLSPREPGRWQIRLADFGNARLASPERHVPPGLASAVRSTGGLGSEPSRGTLIYLAPELLQERPATTSSDLYALGVLLYQLLVGDLRRPLGVGWERDVSDELLRENIARAADGNPALRAGSVRQWVTDLRRLEQRRNGG